MAKKGASVSKGNKKIYNVLSLLTNGYVEGVVDTSSKNYKERSQYSDDNQHGINI